MLKNKKGLYVVFGFLLITMAYSLLKPTLMVLTGYAAKEACSCYYLQGQDKVSIVHENLDFSPVSLASVSWDQAEQSASATLFGLAVQKAIYRKDLGCQLDYPTSKPRPHTYSSNQDSWNLRSRIDSAFNPVVDYAFSDFDNQKTNTRAILIVKDGEILAERYADGFDEESLHLGWSMTKSVAATIFGRMTLDEMLFVDEVPQFMLMDQTNDSISYRHLLNMSSGIEWSEDYSSLSDATAMLYHSPDMFVRSKKSKTTSPPGVVWFYSSGTSNLLNGLMEERFENQEAYRSYVYDSVLFKAGLSSMRIETDASGHFVASSYGYATARDWAAFGLLYLNDGNGPNGRVFNTSWDDFVREEAPGSGGLYGGHFWLNKDHSRYADAPSDLYMARGYKGQRLFIFPSQDLVILRLGLSEPGDDYDNELIRRTLAIISN